MVLRSDYGSNFVGVQKEIEDPYKIWTIKRFINFL